MAFRSDFVAFYRRYTKTWIHALATAALTAFGTLTFVHRGFAVLAVVAYLLPPVLLYVGETDLGNDDAPGETADASRSEGSAGGGSVADDGATADESDPVGEGDAVWTAADGPTDATLRDAAVAGGRAYAVGDGGIVLATEGDGWRPVLPDGPGAASRDLLGADATSDGAAVWVAGDGGALGRFDVETGRHVDHSAPVDRTDSWTAVAAAGPAGEETLLLVTGSGEVLRGRHRDGELAWEAPAKPGSGSSMVGAAMVDAAGYVCDTNDGVFETTDGGETFRQVGIEDLDGTITGIDAAARGDCAVVDDAGVLHRYDGSTWTPRRLGGESLRAVARSGDRTLACGDGGVVHERPDPAAAWERTLAPVAGSLRGIAAGPERAVAVGDGGAILERVRRD